MIDKDVLEKLQEKQIAIARLAPDNPDEPGNTIDTDSLASRDLNEFDSESDRDKLILTPPSTGPLKALPELCVDPCIDLDAAALQDLVSTTPLVPEALSNQNTLIGHGNVHQSGSCAEENPDWDW